MEISLRFLWGIAVLRLPRSVRVRVCVAAVGGNSVRGWTQRAPASQ